MARNPPEIGFEHGNRTCVSPPRPLYHLSFNQDYTNFSAALQNGFSIYNANPLKPLHCRNLGGSVALVAPLFRSYLLCLVGGGGPNPIYAPNKVMIWDNHLGRCIGEMSFRSEVKNVKLRRDAIVVVLLQKVLVYKYPELKILHQFETVANPKGLCELSQTSSPMLLVSLGLQKGQIRVDNYGCTKNKFFMAHDSPVVCMAMSLDGRFLATASSKGTLIRVFNTLNGSLLQEVRRGWDRAEIYSLAFSSKVQWLAVSSGKGTVHVFSLKVDPALLGTLGNDISQAVSETNQSKLSIFKGVLPKYFSSEWSVAQFRLPEGFQYFVAFGQQDNTVLLIGTDGSFYRCEFDPINGGEMIQLERQNFLSADYEIDFPKGL